MSMIAKKISPLVISKHAQCPACALMFASTWMQEFSRSTVVNDINVPTMRALQTSKDEVEGFRFTCKRCEYQWTEKATD